MFKKGDRVEIKLNDEPFDLLKKGSGIGVVYGIFSVRQPRVTYVVKKLDGYPWNLRESSTFKFPHNMRLIND